MHWCSCTTQWQKTIIVSSLGPVITLRSSGRVGKGSLGCADELTYLEPSGTGTMRSHLTLVINHKGFLTVNVISGHSSVSRFAL